MSTAHTDWDGVAEAWDSSVGYVDGATSAATEALVAAVEVRAGDRVLELAAGPGALGSVWSSLVGPSGRVVVSDFAPAMANAARRRCAGLNNVEIAVLDAAAIDQREGAFDAVVCRMGLMFLPEPAVAFGEVHRVLDHDGRFGALTWAGPEHNPWMTCVGMAAMANGLVAGGPPTGPGGIFSLGDMELLDGLAKGAGFVDVRVSEIPVAFHADAIAAHVKRVSALAGPLAAAFEAATSEQLDAVRRSAEQLAAPHATDAGFTLPGRALLVSGRHA